jgi:tetratricopeptide (TPR) repeat protein
VGFDRLAMARIMGRCGDYGQAIAQLDLLLARSPDHWAAAQERAEMQLVLGDMDSAIRNYRRLSEFAAMNAGIQVRFAELLLAAGRLDEAHKVGESMIQTVALRSAGHMVLAMVYYLKGLWIAGADHCRMHLELKPDSMPARILLGRILMRQGEYRKAASLLQSFGREGRQNLESQLMLAECHIELGDQQAATELLNRIQKSNPGYDEPYLLLTRLHMAAGQREKAEESCRKALEVNPKQPVALNNLAILLVSKEPAGSQELQNALELASEAWKLRPDNPEIADTLGWIHALRGDYLPAVSLLNYAARLLPGQPYVHYHLAYALAGMGHLEEASSALAIATELSPDLDRSPGVEDLRQRIEAERAQRPPEQ